MSLRGWKTPEAPAVQPRTSIWKSTLESYQVPSSQAIPRSEMRFAALGARCHRQPFTYVCRYALARPLSYNRFTPGLLVLETLVDTMRYLLFPTTTGIDSNNKRGQGGSAYI